MIRQISDRIAVMYLGRVVEIGESELLYEHPRHPYTAALLSAVPRAEVNGGVGGRKRIVLGGDVPSPVNPPAACVFHPRCPRFQTGLCDVEMPELRPLRRRPRGGVPLPDRALAADGGGAPAPVAVSAPAVSPLDHRGGANSTPPAASTVKR